MGQDFSAPPGPRRTPSTGYAPEARSPEGQDPGGGPLSPFVDGLPYLPMPAPSATFEGHVAGKHVVRNWPKPQVPYVAVGDHAVGAAKRPQRLPIVLTRDVNARVAKRATYHTFRHSFATQHPRLEPRARRRSEPSRPSARGVCYDVPGKPAASQANPGKVRLPAPRC